MPLSQAAPRERKHDRRIALAGYARADGLFDIEAHITDAKTYGFDNIDRGHIAPGAFLHEMWVRLTVDAALLIVSAEASTDHGPYTICPGGAASVASLAGLTIGPGFLRASRERLAGTTGCTHIRELMQQLATTAIQTVLPLRSKAATVKPNAGAARMLDTCYAYARDGDMVRRRWPDLYRGDVPADQPSASAT